ncbi:hypothetical protein Taro_010093 [Colocasia esculenta]|uniref:Uncharacterized protein n=1 Tax=Colocasia esculenta TaxID=4460 RepID=A0A843U2M3_COLES|nr:hypothetical protein [Colocasia esculenta]
MMSSLHEVKKETRRVECTGLIDIQRFNSPSWEIEIKQDQSVGTVKAASKQWKDTLTSVKDISSRHVTSLEELFRTAIKSNEQHDLEIGSVRNAAEDDVVKDSEDIISHFGSIIEHEQESSSRMMDAVSVHVGLLEDLCTDHAAQASEIEQRTARTFQKYKASLFASDYEPSGETPVRLESDVPSKGTIESLRAMPMESLLEEFRENHPYESSKEPRPSLIPRSPLVQLN